MKLAIIIIMINKNISLNKNTNFINKKFNELNTLCSYLAMFPLEVPEKFIREYTKEGDLIFEPFSGRGTTNIAAIKNGRRVISTDLSPLAFVLTKSKTIPVDNEGAINRVKELEEKYKKSKIKINLNKDLFKDIKIFYSKKNLKQLYFIREELGKKFKTLNEIDNYILAISLGIAHGPVRKSGDENNSMYFSVNMSNGMSMAPGYAERYIERHRLHKIETNIFDQIISRIKTKDSGILENGLENKAYLKDATESSALFKKEGCPKLIFTSPPYLNLIKYVDQNWIRFWILGFERKDEETRFLLNDYHARLEYMEFLKKFMIEMHKIMDKSTRLMMVIGDVRENKIKDIMNEIFKDKKISEKFKYDKTMEFKESNPIAQPLKNKTTRQMGNRVGKATDNDWVFSFRRK